jgi:adenylate kinase family enzyme
MTHEQRRIAIIGNAGGGKSVLARALAHARGLPLRTIDDVQWRPGWVRAPLADVAAAHAAWLDEPRWIIDGWGSWDLIERRFDAADTIVVVDFPLRQHFRWALQRQAEVMLGLRSDWPPPGCRAAPVTLELLRVMRRVHRELRPRLLALVARPELRGRVVHLRTTAEYHAFRRTASVGSYASALDRPSVVGVR